VDRERLEYPPPPMFLEQYDSKEFSGWGSAKDMTGKDLGK